jgi:hypothetical protein
MEWRHFYVTDGGATFVWREIEKEEGNTAGPAPEGLDQAGDRVR